MASEEEFLQAIANDPQSDAPRLVMADWLQQHGQPERAEFIRLACRLARTRKHEPVHQPLRRYLEVLARAQLVEWLCVTDGEVLRNLRKLWQPKQALHRRRPRFVLDRELEVVFSRGFPETLIIHRDFQLGSTDPDGEFPWLESLKAAAKIPTIQTLRVLKDHQWARVRDGRPGPAEVVITRTLPPDLLALLQPLAQMREVCLEGVPLAGGTLAIISRWRKLERLDLRGCGVPDDELRALSELRQLRGLLLSGREVGTTAASSLSQLNNLRSVSVVATRLDDRDLECLRNLNLRRLDLSDTAVTDVGLEALAQMDGLVALRLKNTGITDAGIDLLQTLKGLRRLDTRQTQVSNARLQQLAAKRPELSIDELDAAEREPA